MHRSCACRCDAHSMRTPCTRRTHATHAHAILPPYTCAQHASKHHARTRSNMPFICTRLSDACMDRVVDLPAARHHLLHRQPCSLPHHSAHPHIHPLNVRRHHRWYARLCAWRSVRDDLPPASRCEPLARLWGSLASGCSSCAATFYVEQECGALVWALQVAHTRIDSTTRMPHTIRTLGVYMWLT